MIHLTVQVINISAAVGTSNGDTGTSCKTGSNAITLGGALGGWETKTGGAIKENNRGEE